MRIRCPFGPFGKPFGVVQLLFCALASLPGASVAPAADDERPVVDDSKFAADPAAHAKLPTLYVVGDSTVRSDAPMRGWGQEIGTFFDPAKINVVNRAIGGRSSRTFQTEGKWERVLEEIKPGDFVLVQFGHNDVGQYDDPKAKGRPSLHGRGEETAEAAKADGAKETVHTFGWYMRRYVADAKARGATVILCSMVPHKDWKEGKLARDDRDTFVKWTADAARSSGAPFIDLNQIVADGYDKLGPEKVEAFFADKRTHTTAEGAGYTAAAVVAGLKGLKPDPLVPYYGKAAEAVAAATRPAATNQGAAARDVEFSVGNYGASGDGKAVCTVAVQKAIDAASGAGGGTVVFPRGVYLSGSLFLKSGVNFRVDEGVEIRGVQDDAAYPDMWTRIAGIEMTWPAALINVCQQSNVRIYGKGLIDGQGSYWWHKFWGEGEEHTGGMLGEYEKKGLRWAVDYDCKRPRLIQVYKSADVSVEGLELHRSGFWTVHVCFSSKVNVDGLTIRNNIGGHGPSSDGIDIDSSRDVVVRNCDIDCNDDSLCIKAGRDADGLRVNRPTENVVVHDCTIRGGHSLFTIGSETSGGVRNVEAYRIKAVADTGAGIRLKSTKTRGGTIEKIDIHDIEMDGVSRPIEIDLNWFPSYSNARLPGGAGGGDAKDIPPHWKVLTQPVPPEKGFPHFRDVRIRNLTARNAAEAFKVEAYQEAPVERFLLEDVKIEAREGGEIKHARDWTFKNVTVTTGDKRPVRMEDCHDMHGEIR